MSLQKFATRRILSFFSPCIWGPVDGFGWIRRILHANPLGKLLSQRFWINLHRATLDDCGYAKDERLRLLEPETRYATRSLCQGSVLLTDTFLKVPSGTARPQESTTIRRTSLHSSVLGKSSCTDRTSTISLARPYISRTAGPS